jgi:DNA-binding transcriptional MerR regulator
MNHLTPKTASVYRIGAVSKLSGIPVPTLRVWQTRYNAFSPTTSLGQHRLYNEDDLRKAALLKQLTSQGHGIGLIAGLSTLQLQQLQATDAGIAAPNALTRSAASSLDATGSAAARHWWVVGHALAQRLQSTGLASVSLSPGIALTPIGANLQEAMLAPAEPLATPSVLWVSVNGLDMATAQQVLALAKRLGAQNTVVLHSYGQKNATALLEGAAIFVQRDTLNDQALVDLVRRLRPPVSAPAWAMDSASSSIPDRQFSDAVLQRVANIPSQVLCECPRHVAELIGLLARFEDYSRDCQSLNINDAQLHAHLNRMAATARAMFEQGLQMVASHEGISLQESVP